MDEIPEVRLTPEAKARRRAELMDALAESRGRRAWLVPVAAAATVAVVGGAVALAAGLGGDGGAPDDDRSPVVAGSGTAGDPTSAPPTEASRSPEECALPQIDQWNPPPWRDPALAPYLDAYRDILARHLDPRDRHLERRPSNVQSGGGRGCSLSALGTKLGWRVEGEDGLGVVQVEVGRGWRDSQIRMHREAFGGQWRTVPLDVAGVEEARAMDYDGGIAVAVTRTNGITVAIDANGLFGNNSLTPVAGFDFTVDDLLAAAADPAFDLP